MKKKNRILALILAVAMALSIVMPTNIFAAEQDTTIIEMKTNDLVDPMGIDTSNPVFSWKMDSTITGQKQTAYQILVAKDKDLKESVWDSEKQETSQSVGIQYAGEPLENSTTYYWQVTVWDKDGKSIASDVATFEVGLMGEDAWDGSRWIQMGTSTEPPEIVGKTNYTIEFDVQVDNTAVGFLLEAKDTSNYLMWQFNISSGKMMLNPHTKIGGNYNGFKSVDISSGVKGEITDVQHVKLEVNEDIGITTYLNGTKVDVTELSQLGGIGFNGTIGKIGFRTSSKEIGWLDNIVLTDYSEDENGVVVKNYHFDNGENPFTAGSIQDGRLNTGLNADCLEKGEEQPPLDDKTHYTVDVDMTCETYAVSAIFNAVDQSNFYMWQLNTKDQEGKVILKPHTWKNGAYATYNSQNVDVTDAVGGVENFKTTPAHMHLDVNGTRIETYINDTLVSTFMIGSTSDQSTTGIPVKAGYLGVRSSVTDGVAEYGTVDNFKLTDYTDNEQGTVLYNYTFENGENPFGKGEIKDGAFVVTKVDILLPIEAQNNGAQTFRKQFNVKDDLVSAKLYTTGLGVYDVHLNGERVGQVMADGSVVYDELKPGYTAVGDRVLYNTYDVTSMVQSGGDNTITANVTSGWWNGRIANSGRNNGFRAKMLLTYSDGHTEVMGTDQTWRTAYAGPVISADIYEGETYDANADLSYRENGFDDSNWNYADICTAFRGEISAQAGDSVRVRTDLELHPKEITVYHGVVDENENQYGRINVTGNYQDGESFTLKAGETAVFDLGQNFAGRPVIQVEGPKDTTVTIRHGEMLNDNDGLKSRGNDGPEGSIYTANLRTAPATAHYIMNGNGVETYFSTHTFYGFRYVEVTATSEITIHNLKGEVLTSVKTDTGKLSTSDEDVNQLISNTVWGQYSNYLSVPTDCPQRDERQGWTADTQVFSTAAAYNAESKAFLQKWMRDMRDDQASNGAYPDTAPGGGSGQLGWSDAGIIVPYNMYKMYGDKTFIEENYASMQKYIDVYLASTNKKGAGHAYGDWLAYESNDDDMKSLLGIAFYAWDAQMMAEMAEVMGKPEDVAKYQQIYEIEKEYFQQQYVNEDGSLKRGEQTACLYALYLDLLPNEDSFETVKQQLLDNISRNGNKLQTGFLGTAIIMQTLSKIGADDVAYQLLLQHGNPSWLYSVDQGATTMWERWNSYTKETGFGDVSMNSFNHYAYGAVAEWMYGYMAGILYDFDQPGFQHIILQPTPDQSLDFVNGEYNSAYGKIISNWKYEGNTWSYEAVVPANTTATIYLPVEDGKPFTVNGKTPEDVTVETDGLAYKGMEDGKAVFEAVAGSYSFQTEVTEYCYVTIGNADETVPNQISVNGGIQQSLPLTIKATVGETITLEAKPINDVDYQFVGWSGDVSSNDSKITVTPTADMALTVSNTWIGNENLALNSKVDSNCSWTVSTWAPEYLVDGILTSNGEHSGFTSGQTSTDMVDYWIELDLGADVEMNRIHLYPRSDVKSNSGGTPSFPRDFSIQIKADGASEYTTVAEYTDYQAPQGKPAVFEFDLTNARYIRLRVTRLGDPPAGETNYLQLAEMGVYHTTATSVDKTALENLYNSLKDTDLSQYKDGSAKDTFKAELEKAATLLGSDTATQDEINNAVTSLQAAFDALEKKPVDKHILQYVIEQAIAKKDTDEYKNVIPAVKESYNKALEEAQAVYNDPNASQEEVNQAYAEMIRQIQNLNKQAGDKTELQALYDQVKDTDLDQYLDGETKENFKTALAAAKDVLDDENALVKDVETAYNNLKASYEALEKKP
ncbi:MAG: hypothetical protein DBX37_06040, partial [Massilioclostridium sp.]